MWSVWLPLLLLIIAGLWLIWRRHRLMQALVVRGRQVSAMVMNAQRLQSNDSSSLQVTYSFRDHQGRRQQNTVVLSGAAAESVKTGATIVIVYLPENPKVSTSKSLVDTARHTMHKP